MPNITMRTIVNLDETKAWIKKCEGYNAKPYICSAGKLSIGWGRNLQDNGISIDEAELMFNNDFARAEKELRGFTWYLMAPDSVKSALLNMNFNLGLSKLLGFRKMILALIDKDYTNAAIEALDSKWATQVGNRAKDIALMIREAK